MHPMSPAPGDRCRRWSGETKGTAQPRTDRFRPGFSEGASGPRSELVCTLAPVGVNGSRSAAEPPISMPPGMHRHNSPTSLEIAEQCRGVQACTSRPPVPELPLCTGMGTFAGGSSGRELKGNSDAVPCALWQTGFLLLQSPVKLLMASTPASGTIWRGRNLTRIVCRISGLIES